MKKIEELIDKLAFIVSEQGSSQLIPVHVLDFEGPSWIRVLPLNEDLFGNREIMSFDIETENELSLDGKRYYIWDKDDLELRMKEVDDEKLLTDTLSNYISFEYHTFNYETNLNVGDEIAYIRLDENAGEILSKPVSRMLIENIINENNSLHIFVSHYWHRTIKREYTYSVGNGGIIDKSETTVDIIVKLEKYGND